MNIIITSLSADKIAITGLTTATVDIDSTKLFIQNDVDNQSDILIQLQNESSNYPLAKVAVAELDKNEYKGYRLVSDINIPNGVYSIQVLSGSLIITLDSQITLENQQYLADEEEPVYVIGRKINPIKTEVVAQDVGSQCFTFYIRKKYDGISFLDDTKKIYVDYIPVNKEDLIVVTEDGEEYSVNFLSDHITEIYPILPPHGREGEWLALKWHLPYKATKTAGVVKIAISVIDVSGDARTYTWQTAPGSFKVSPNLGFRKEIVLTPEEESVLTTLVENVSVLQEDVSSIESALGHQTDGDSSNNEDIFFSGGNAEV